MEQGTLFSAGPSDGRRLTREDIARRLATRPPARPRPDGSPDPATVGHGPEVPGAPMLAAVLVPLVERAGGMTVLLTQRTAHLAHHPGQISFPGGRLEEVDDGDAIRCALRETNEEIGLDIETVAVLGRLDDWATGTGFLITPVIGAFPPPRALRLDTFEVAEAFEVPLDFVLDTANRQLQYRDIAGRRYPFWTIPWQNRVIWGATAGILVCLSEILSHHAR